MQYLKAIFNAASPVGTYKENIRIDFEDENGNKVSLPISIIKGKTEGAVFTIVERNDKRAVLQVDIFTGL
ncbi:MAG: hypothetical protein AAF992_16160 [Bacteroidota bacterium]